jgi:acetyl-CoA decarbonylase/synthase complex subunit delta
VVPIPTELPAFVFVPPVREYKGKMKEVTIGATKEEGGTRAFKITVGGSVTYPWYKFEGEMYRRPVIAHTVVDEDPRLPKRLKKFYGDVVNDAVKWAKKCVEEYGAKMIFLYLKSTDPSGTNRSPEEAAETVKDVLRAVSVPLIIGVASGDMRKDAAVIEKCAEAAKGENVLLMSGSLTIPDMTGVPFAKGIPEFFQAAAKYGHCMISYQPLNAPGMSWLTRAAIEQGVPPNKIMGDPGLAPPGYAIEKALSAIDAIYTKSFLGDEDFQIPIIVAPMNAWLYGEAYSENEEWGPAEYRGEVMEETSLAAAMISGGHILVMMDQDAIKMAESILDHLYTAEKAAEPSEVENWIRDIS